MAGGFSGEFESKGHNGGLILVVEDDLRTLRLERFVLEEEGFTVREAKSGEEALQALDEGPTALVLLDIGLPGIDGFTTCRRIRKAPQVPIIIVTAEDRDEDKVYGLEMGADDYVTKPFSTTELAARVKAVLRRYDLGSTGTQSAMQSGSSPETGAIEQTRSPAETGGSTETGITAGTEAVTPERVAKEDGHPESAQPAGRGMSTGDRLSKEPDPAYEVVARNTSIANGLQGPAPSDLLEYEGTVRLLVESSGSVSKMIRFVDELRQHQLFRLLRLNANPSREGMEILLRMREPVRLKGILLQMENVSAVDERPNAPKEIPRGMLSGNPGNLNSDGPAVRVTLHE